ncbi:MAG: aldehyde dehydrogenase family protein [Chthoniobacterales bacterium]
MIALLDPQKMLEAAAEEVRTAVTSARSAQIDWARQSTRARAKLIGTLRPLLAEQATSMARITAALRDRPVAEKMTSEILPLLAAIRFLHTNAPRLLRTKRHARRGRPLWLGGHSFTVERKPFGVVLIVAPANYPLFLPAVQMLHALVAGNAVLIKPAESASPPIEHFVRQIIARSRIPSQLVQILPETPEAARQAVRYGIDKAIFTGSSENGRDFLAELAKQNTPSVMELSGADAVFVRADADVELASKAIAFGLRLNAGDTCMAPASVIVHEAVAAELSNRLEALGLATEGLFIVRDDAQALEVAALDDYGLGASIFSRDEAAAQSFARRLNTGFVTINDIIVPTADPRFPFGGTRGSGFGTTRGAEGLLEMTYPQAVATRRGRFLPHLNPAKAGDEDLFGAFVAAAHGRGLGARFRALRSLIRLSRNRGARS